MVDHRSAMRDANANLACVATSAASHSHESGASSVGSSPEQMRAAMAEYVAALHRAYLDQAAHLTPGERAELPLVLAGNFTVLAVGTRHLHIVATTAPLPRPAGPEVELTGDDRDLTWTLRFFDATVLPELGILDETNGADALGVRRALGITDVVYHVSLAPGGGLSAHHAQHAGTGLANGHASSVRDYDGMRAWAPSQLELIDEFAAAQRLGLTTAARLLAREISPHDAGVPAATDAVTLRKALLTSLKPPALS